jgi:hypothetical protein
VLTVVKPSPLRLWGFVLTALGGALVAFGSIGTWARVTLGNRTAGAVPTTGIDVWPGVITVCLGAAIVIGILALRFVRPDRRLIVAAGILVLALAAVLVSLVALATLHSVVRDAGTDALIREVAEQLGMSMAAARVRVTQALARLGIGIRAQIGLWLALAGAAIAAVGGILDLLWVRQKRIRGESIDPDTLPQTRTLPENEA